MSKTEQEINGEIQVELRQLQYFVKVAKKQHVTRAAEELHVAQSAVSRQIGQLEQELGVNLFIQKGRNLHLTPAGKLFLDRVEKILYDLDKAVNEVREFIDPETGEIRLGFPHTLGVNIVPVIVSHFRQEYPNVTFRFKQGMYHSLIQSVVDGDLDLALISPCPEEHEHVVGEVLLTEALYAILPRNHRLADCESIHLSQLKDDSFVLFSEGYSLRSIVWEACLKAGFTPKVGFEGEETETISALVAAGMGVSLLPEMALKDESPDGPIKVKVIEPEVTRTAGLIRRKGEELPQVAEVFRQFLLRYYKAEKVKN
jgi:LysR family transcriptional activator of glutamate synthase operon